MDVFLHRLASGLVFLTGGALSRLGVAAESWPVLGLGLMAASVGLWHFLMGGAATSLRQEVPDPAAPVRAVAPARDEPSPAPASR